MKTRAMVLERFNEPLVLKEVEVPPLEPGQVLVRIEAAGICGSDVHMWKGNDERTPLPIILGHEGVGRVVDSRRPSCKPGELVLWNRGITCGECYYCQVLKEPSLCENRRVYGINRPMTEPPCLNGCYAEHVILTAQTDILPVREPADPAILAPATCAGATMAHAFALANPSPGDTVLVQGPGPLGLFAIVYARECGASEIIVIGGSKNRLDICREFGATMLLDRNETTNEERRRQVLDRTGGRGVDLAVEAAGQPPAVTEGLALLRHGGTYLSTGFSQPPGEVQVDFFREIVRKNIGIQGVWVSDADHLRRAASVVLEREELFARMITHRFPLENANDALHAMDAREALKAVLIPAGG